MTRKRRLGISVAALASAVSASSFMCINGGGTGAIVLTAILIPLLVTVLWLYFREKEYKQE